MRVLTVDGGGRFRRVDEDGDRVISFQARILDRQCKNMNPCSVYFLVFI